MISTQRPPESIVIPFQRYKREHRALSLRESKLIEMIKICYIIGQLSRAGAERQLFELVKAINRHRFEPIVISLSRGGSWAENMRGLHIQVIELERKKNREVARLFTLVRLLKEIRPEIVHTYLFSGNSYGRVASILNRVPVIVSSERNLPELGKDKDIFRILVDKLLAPFTDGIICNSYRASHSLREKYFFDHRKLYTIHNGISGDTFLPRDPNGSKNTKTVIGTVGRLQPQKNHRLFLDVAKIVLDMSGDGNIEFVIAGTGPLMRELRNYSAKLGIEDKVLFLGERSDVPEVLQGLDVFVMTSSYEGLSNTIMEAMSAGLPVVATAVGGNDELVIDRATGFLCPPSDAHKLAERVIHLINNEEEAREMGRNGRRRITTEFGIEKMVQKTENIYMTLLEHKMSGQYPGNINVQSR